VALAKAIVKYREGKQEISGPSVTEGGPFRSIFELNRVRATQGTGSNTTLLYFQPGWFPTTSDPDDALGDVSPFGINALDGVRSSSTIADFEEQFLAMTRVSNLVTTRSDSFTAYITVQGWRNAGSSAVTGLSAPELVVQRRLGVFIDRTPVFNATSRGAADVKPFPLD